MFDHIIPHNTPLSSPSVTAGNSAWHRKLVRQGSEPIQPPTQTCSKVRFFLSLLISADRGMMVCRTWVHSQTKYCNRAPYASQLGRMPSPKLLLYHTVRLPCSRRVTAYLSVTSTASTGSLIKEYEVVDFNPIQSPMTAMHILAQHHLRESMFSLTSLGGWVWKSKRHQIRGKGYQTQDIHWDQTGFQYLISTISVPLRKNADDLDPQNTTTAVVTATVIPPKPRTTVRGICFRAVLLNFRQLNFF